MKRHWYMIYFGLIIGGLFTLGITMFIRPAKHFSENENRVLQQIPAFSLNSFVQGQYQEKLEKGADDQFPGRDGLTATASICKRMMGQKDIGDTYLGKDHYYLAKKTEDSIDMFRYMENLRYVEYVGSQRASKSTLLLVPDAGTILADKLPAQAPFYQAAALYRATGSVCKQTTFVDIRQAMNEQKKSEQLYYRTDHHWTLAGAYVGYQQLCQPLHLTKQPYEHFKPKMVSKNFLGTLHSRVLGADAKADTIYAVDHLPEISSVVCDGKEKHTIYDVSKCSTKDKYAYFFGGNYGEITIKMSEQNHTGKNLIVFKDSFANCLVPFLLEQYDQVTMIDLRYCRKSVINILQQKKDAEILFLYEMSNFAEDNNIWKLTK